MAELVSRTKTLIANRINTIGVSHHFLLVRKKSKNSRAKPIRGAFACSANRSFGLLAFAGLAFDRGVGDSVLCSFSSWFIEIRS